jgi:hypothetical protein
MKKKILQDHNLESDVVTDHYFFINHLQTKNVSPPVHVLFG